MRGAIDETDLDIDHREAGENAGAQRSFETFLDRREKLPRHRSTDDFVLEHETFAGRARFGNDLDAGELTVAASLLLMGVVLGRPPRDLLAIGDLRRADIGVDFVGALENIDLDVEVQLTHALDD